MNGPTGMGWREELGIMDVESSFLDGSMSTRSSLRHASVLVPSPTVAVTLNHRDSEVTDQAADSVTSASLWCMPF